MGDSGGGDVRRGEGEGNGEAGWRLVQFGRAVSAAPPSRYSGTSGSCPQNPALACWGATLS